MRNMLRQFRAALRILIWILKGEMDMVAVYVALILAGRRTFAQVPTAIREAVREELVALDLEALA